MDRDIVIKLFFPLRLSKLRKEEGYSQLKMAHFLSIDIEQYKNWENGTEFPEISELIKLCFVLFTNLEYILGYSNERFPSVWELGGIGTDKATFCVKPYKPYEIIAIKKKKLKKLPPIKIIKNKDNILKFNPTGKKLKQ